MRFTKVEGAGNDYVLVDVFDQLIEDPAALSRRVSDRHRGIGSDGLLLVGHSTAEVAGHALGAASQSVAVPVARMRIFNADGSEGQMCGNGLRCVVRYLLESGRVPAGEVLLETASGILRSRVDPEGSVEVDMGCPSFLPDSLPCDLPDEGGGALPAVHPLPPGLEGQAEGAYAVSTGNPHLVLRVKDLVAFDLARHGKSLQASPRLGQGANVHAVQMGPSDTPLPTLIARPWERGSGATQACGTGAVAIAAVARALGWVPGAELTIRMPGGELGVRWDENAHAWLSGPAELVFQGEWPVVRPLKGTNS